MPQACLRRRTVFATSFATHDRRTQGATLQGRAVHHAKGAKIAKRAATISPFPCSVGACLRRSESFQIRERRTSPSHTKVVRSLGRTERISYRNPVSLCALCALGVRVCARVWIDRITPRAPRSPRGPRQFPRSPVASELASDVRSHSRFANVARRRRTQGATPQRPPVLPLAVLCALCALGVRVCARVWIDRITPRAPRSPRGPRQSPRSPVAS